MTSLSAIIKGRRFHMPGPLNIYATDESNQQAQPTPKVRNKKLGYVLGGAVSAVAAILVFILSMVFLQLQVVRCFMSLGCDDGGTTYPVWLALAGYVLVVILAAALTWRMFNTRIGPALLLNVAPLFALTALQILLVQYSDYSHRSSRTSGAKTAISDVSAIHLGDPFIKTVEMPNGGVVMFLHVPFTVSRIVQAHSLDWLAMFENRDLHRFSPREDCDDSFEVPDHGFHIVDREYSEPPFPIYATRTEIVSRQLNPNKQYYLLQEIHFPNTTCRVSDYQGFDPKELRVILSTSNAEQVLSDGGR